MFKILKSCFTVSVLLVVAAASEARDEVGDYSIDEAMATEAAKEKLTGEVAFYFAGQAHSEPVKTYGTYGSNKKTNAFGKSDTRACQWAFLSAMISLQERALAEGGNAVVDIKSNYRDNLTESADTFKCGAGNIMAGVALQGKVVTLP